jgi:outer membrane lipoprotein LolB
MRLIVVSLIFATLLIAGCAVPTRATAQFDTNSPHWQGRLGLKVYSTPIESISADFDLMGDASRGRLVLTSALGTTLARIEWAPDEALLQADGKLWQFQSMDALTRQTLGTELPVSALFAWLTGQEVNTPGWEADLSMLKEGRLTARRSAPAVPAELKIILER